MKNAFTMIELVFVIVIIGILSAVALPKFLNTRDSANIAKEVGNLRTARTELMSGLLLGETYSNISHAPVNCFSFTNDATNKTLTITGVTTYATWCANAITKATATDLMSPVSY